LPDLPRIEEGSENELLPSDEDEYMEDLPQVIQNNKAKGPRTSVSTEVFGTWNKKSDFKAPAYPRPRRSRTHSRSGWSKLLCSRASTRRSSR